MMKLVYSAAVVRMTPRSERTSRFWQLAQRAAAVLSSEAGFLRRLAIFALAGQLSLCIAAAFCRVMLFGDGSFFVYALATGHAWQLKWQFLTTRLSTYLLTVLPTEAICDAVSCTGSQIAVVNGAVFYLVPVLQFAYLVHIARQRFPALLFFPLAQYAFALGLGFGFPSEILLAPGFFWICLFSILQRPLPLYPLIFSFAGLVFSHELALAAAAIVLFYFPTQVRDSAGRPAIPFDQARIFLVAAGIVLLLDAILILSGGGSGGNANAMHVFSLRRLLIDPAAWMVAVGLMAAAMLASLVKRKLPLSLLFVFAALCVLFTVLAGAWLNYASGRYDSARTLIGLSMVGLGLAFVLVRAADNGRSEVPPSHTAFLRLGLLGVLVITLSANVVFLMDWNRGLLAFEKAVKTPSATGQVAYDSGSSRLGAEGFKYTDRAGFSWAWPYRSIVLARNFRPQAIFFLPDSISRACGSPRLTHFADSPVPAEVTRDLARFACAQPRSVAANLRNAKAGRL